MKKSSIIPVKMYHIHIAGDAVQNPVRKNTVSELHGTMISMTIRIWSIAAAAAPFRGTKRIAPEVPGSTISGISAAQSAAAAVVQNPVKKHIATELHGPMISGAVNLPRH